MSKDDNQELNSVKKEDDFIQEKIVSRRRKKIVRRLITVGFVLVCGLVFGFSARMAMIFTDGKLKDLLVQNTATPTAMPTPTEEALHATDTPIPTNPVISSVPVTFTPTPTEAEPLPPVPTLEPIYGEVEIPVREPGAGYPVYSYTQIYTAVATLAENMKPILAEVTTVRTSTDWFGEKTNVVSQAAGLVMSDNGVSLLILVDSSAVVGSDSVSVKVMDKTAEGKIAAMDEEFGVAVLSMDLNAFTEEERSKFKYPELLPESVVKAGMPLVAVGNANGNPGSIAFGMVSSTGSRTPVTDGQIKSFTTDWTDYAGSSAFVFDMNGALVGMVTHTYKHNKEDGITTCVALESIKDVLTALINERDLLYLGISGIEIPDAAKETSGLSFGIYVRGVKGLSPAANADLREGDIIMSVNQQAVQSVSELTMFLAGMAPGDTLTIDYRRVYGTGVRDERVVVTPVEKAMHFEQKGTK